MGWPCFQSTLPPPSHGRTRSINLSLFFFVFIFLTPFSPRPWCFIMPHPVGRDHVNPLAGSGALPLQWALLLMCFNGVTKISPRGSTEATSVGKRSGRGGCFGCATAPVECQCNPVRERETNPISGQSWFFLTLFCVIFPPLHFALTSDLFHVSSTWPSALVHPWTRYVLT